MLCASVGPPQDKEGGPASATLADSPVPGLVPVEQWEERPRDQAPRLWLVDMDSEIQLETLSALFSS